MGLWIRWELRTWFERGAKRGCFGHLLYTVKCGPDLWRSRTSGFGPIPHLRNGDISTVDRGQVARASERRAGASVL